MGSVVSVILRPVISEKSYKLTEQNKYTFYIDPRAHKTQVAQAVASHFKVQVTDVHTLTLRGKPKRRGAFKGRTAARKKAIVTLAAGDKIDFFTTS